MYPHSHGAMPPPQARTVAPETFLLDQDAQQSLPPDAIVALQQVDNRKFDPQQLSFPSNDAIGYGIPSRTQRLTFMI